MTIAQWSSSCHRLIQAHKPASVRRSVRNFVSAVWDKEKQNAVLSGTYDKFRHFFQP